MIIPVFSEWKKCYHPLGYDAVMETDVTSKQTVCLRSPICVVHGFRYCRENINLHSECWIKHRNMKTPGYKFIYI